MFTYFTGIPFDDHAHAADEIKRIVESYNERRPNLSLDYHTPQQAHEMEGTFTKRWKRYSRRKKINTGVEVNDKPSQEECLPTDVDKKYTPENIADKNWKDN